MSRSEILDESEDTAQDRYQEAEARKTRSLIALWKFNGERHPVDSHDTGPDAEHERQFKCACGCETPLGWRDDVIGTDNGTVIAGHNSKGTE